MQNLSIVLSNSIWHKNHRDIEVLNDLDWINLNLASSINIELHQLTKSFLNDLFLLRSICLQVLEVQQIEDYLEKINVFLSHAKYTSKVSIIDGNVQIINTLEATSERQLLIAIATDLVKLFENGEITRVRTCANCECQFYFIDHSKNKSKIYCSKRCGNLIKVRRYREKH